MKLQLFYKKQKTKKVIYILILGKLYFTLLNYPLIYTFTCKVLNVTLYPPKLSNCGNSTTLTFFSQNAPISYFILFYFKIKKYAGVASYPLWGGSATPTIFFFFLDFFMIGAFWEKNVSGQNATI